MKKIMSMVLCLSILCAFPQKVKAVSVSAQSAVLIDAASGNILYEKNAHSRRGMASTTKIMTAICAIENMESDTVVTIPAEAVGVEGSSVYLKKGEKITLENLLYALMLQSANDAAVAIAIAVSGSVEAFASVMNEKAERLGLRDTHFENPHGLDGKEHYTTAYELAKITQYALKNELFACIVSTSVWNVSADGGETARTFVNHNRLLRSYKDIIGVKTGFTKKCGRTLVSAASKDGITLICVTLDDGDDWRDHRAMLDYGFDLYEEVSVCEEGSVTLSLPIAGFSEKRVTVSNRESVRAMLPKTHGKITHITELPRFVYDGQKMQTPIGKVRFFCDGRQIGVIPLYLLEQTATEKTKK